MEGRAGRVAISQISAGPQELAPVRDRRLRPARGLGLGAARPALDRPPRPAQRAPAPNPALMTAGRPRPRCRPATSRASPTPSAPCSERSTPTWSRGAAASPGLPTFADGHDEMLVGDAIAESARDGRVGRPSAAPCRPPPSWRVAMKLGFLTAPFPDTPLMDVADWAAAPASRSSRSPAGRAGRADAPLRRHEPHRRREPVGGAGDRDRRGDRAKGLAISGLGFYPNPLHPDPAHRARSSATSRRSSTRPRRWTSRS